LYIQQLTIPTVVFWGEKAQFTRVRIGERLSLLNPNAIQKFYAIPNSGILPHLEIPSVLTALINQHLF
jgi:pimeloyl-ACP methyl ester carboxylesterase